MEYMIQESALMELADAVRHKMEYKDMIYALICNRERIITATITENITVIRPELFTECTNLKELYVYPTTPPFILSSNQIPTSVTIIHVPMGSGDAYKSATNWSDVADIIVEDIVVE